MSIPSTLPDFWEWFRENGNRLRDTVYGENEGARHEALDELASAKSLLARDLILELGRSLEGGVAELVVSADGRPERVDEVKSFVSSAPKMEGWEVVAFRPRMSMREGLEIQIQGETIGPSDVWYRVTPEEDGLGLTLYVQGLTDENEEMRGLGASLLAEHEIGERDVLTLLSSLGCEALPADPQAEDLQPFKTIVATFEEARIKRYPPPGSLTVDDGKWQMLEGEINEKPAWIFINRTFDHYVGHPDYDGRLTVRIRFHDVREDGLPTTEEEYAEAQELSEQVCKMLQQGQESLHVMTLVMDGRRDMILYTNGLEQALAHLNSAPTNDFNHRLETEFEWDTAWGMYRAFVQAGDQDDEPSEN
ncbi:MAG: DUF695 domain-containing protein [Gemmataceae bacterium]